MTGKQPYLTAAEYLELHAAVDALYNQLVEEEWSATTEATVRSARFRQRRLLRAWELVQDELAPLGSREERKG